MLRLYGTAKSRASRALLALEELSLTYEHVPLIPRPGTADRETLMGLNPNGHIPVLEDDGLLVGILTIAAGAATLLAAG